MPWTNPSTKVTGNLITATDWNGFGNNFLFLKEVAYAEFTTNISVTQTTLATAPVVVSSGAIVYENVPHLIHFHCTRVDPPASATATIKIVLADGATGLGWMGNLVAATASTEGNPLDLFARVVPTAASHTYQIKAYVSTGTGILRAAAAAADDYRPGFIRITRLPA
jgi:hypothetical protein